MEPELPPPPPAKASDGFERLAFEDSVSSWAQRPYTERVIHWPVTYTSVDVRMLRCRVYGAQQM